MAKENPLDLDAEYDAWYWRMVEEEELKRLDKECDKDCGVNSVEE